MQTRFFFLVLCGLLSYSADGQANDEQPVLIFSTKKQISPSGPVLIFKLFDAPSFSNYHYHVIVYSEDGSAVVQDLGEFRNGVNLEQYPHSFEIVDVDGDGFADIRILAGLHDVNTRDKPWYKVWIYDPKEKKYAFKP